MPAKIIHLDSFEAICTALETKTNLYASRIRRAALDHAVENLSQSRTRQTSRRLTQELQAAEERFTEWVLELLSSSEDPGILPRFVFNERPLRLLARATALALRPYRVPSPTNPNAVDIQD